MYIETPAHWLHSTLSICVHIIFIALHIYAEIVEYLAVSKQELCTLTCYLCYLYVLLEQFLCHCLSLNGNGSGGWLKTSYPIFNYAQSDTRVPLVVFLKHAFPHSHTHIYKDINQSTEQAVGSRDNVNLYTFYTFVATLRFLLDALAVCSSFMCFVLLSRMSAWILF